MNLAKQLREKRQLEETKAGLKISRLRERKLRGLQIVAPAKPCDKDVLDHLDKTREIKIAHGAPLTQRLKIELNKEE